MERKLAHSILAGPLSRTYSGVRENSLTKSFSKFLTKDWNVCCCLWNESITDFLYSVRWASAVQYFSIDLHHSKCFIHIYLQSVFTIQQLLSCFCYSEVVALYT